VLAGKNAISLAANDAALIEFLLHVGADSILA